MSLPSNGRVIRKPLKLIGLRFGRLVVLRLDHVDVYGNRRFECRCDCGNKAVVRGYLLKKGHTQSCGCLQRDRSRRHGHTCSGGVIKKSRAYSAWQGALDRCRNENHKWYPWYGGRGIQVCERWNKFENFLADMGEPPPKYSLDRYPNNDGNYEPGNCRWATMSQQLLNTRRTVFLTVDGKRMSVTDWARETGICRETLYGRIRKGWSHEKVVMTPVKI